MPEADHLTAAGRLPDIGDADWRAALAAAALRAPDPELAASGLTRLVEAGGPDSLLTWPAADTEGLAVVVGSSPALTRYLVGHGEGWPRAAARLHEACPGRDELVATMGLEAGALEPATVAVGLRRMARREMFRIGARDLLGLASLGETLAAITLLAEVAIDLAVVQARSALAAERGDVVDADGAPVGFVVLGLGKLGGGELNYSSDVDLVYLYSDAPAAEGSPEPRAFFTRLASEVTRLVGETTADGNVFRVDLRLRPEGNNGPMVNSVDNALGYYEGWGDTWERGALAKARVVGGEHEVGESFIDQIRPFVYRRHLDYLTVEDFKRMKERIDAEQIVRARGARDVKLGAGGIRELEFVVQVLQLIHAGHARDLQVAGTMAALAALERHALIATEQAQLLREAYAFLRNVEHAIQVVEQRQSQRLPDDAHGLRTLARRLGYGTGRRGAAADGDEVVAFEADWARHTHLVCEAFVRFLELRPDGAADDVPDDLDSGRATATDPQAVALLAMLERGDDADAAGVLEEMGFPDGARAAISLSRLYRGRVVGPASPQRRRAVQSMAPVLLTATAASADPENALDRLVDFLVRTGAHTSYAALLSGSPTTMRTLVSLFATSSYLASRLVGHPELLDMLVRSDADPSGRDAPTLRLALAEDLAGELDEEAVMAALRRFRTSELIRAGIDDLSGLLDAEEVLAQLSDLAEACLLAAGDEARRLTAERIDVPAGGVDLTVVAMGKMGGREMSYGSDLDLLFVYAGGEDVFDADAHAFATRWAQKTMSLLQTATRDGIVYQIDARLRPSGRSGPLVTSLARFIEYHEKEAQLWERQAHVRARVVSGGDALRARVEGLVEHFVYGCGLADEQLGEIDALRRRVEDELAAEAADRVNIKTGRGGIVDIEFIVQMLQLRHGHEHAEVRRPGTLKALRALRAGGLLPDDDADRLETHYLFLRRLEARMRLERDRPVEQLGTATGVIAPLARRLGFEGDDAGAALLRAYEETREEVRSIYERYFSPGSS